MSAGIAGSSARPGFILFAYGFRPFFLLAGIYATVPVAATVWVLAGGRWPAQAPPLFSWHGHEMLFGFVSAAVAGFLLTAVPTWTGTKSVSGVPLACLVLLWLAGRAVSSPWVAPSNVFVQILGIAFLPALAVTVAFPLIRTKNFRNLPFILLLAILFVADFVSQSLRYGWTDEQLLDGQRLAINAVALMIVIIGGRIVPAFTRNALIALRRESALRNQRAIDIASIVLVAAVLVGDILAAGSIFTGLLAAFAAALLLVRLSGWGGFRVLDVPLLWVLHLGYGWLVLAFALKALWVLGALSWAVSWMHAFTAGTFGTMILGVMTRVALGHTGRPLRLARAVTVSYVLVSAAALIRVFAPAVAGTHYTEVLAASALAWTSAFAIFLVIYTPILLSPRVDGKVG